MSEMRGFFRVYRLPKKLTNGFCFGGGVPITFTNVDWFDGFEGMAREQVEKWIRGKAYFDPTETYLVLADDPALTFTIGEVTR